MNPLNSPSDRSTAAGYTSSGVRPLPIMVKPVPGEGFRSFVDRLAAHYDVPLSTMLAYVGLVEPDSVCKVPSYGLVLDSARLAGFSHATRLDPALVESMLLSHFDGTAIDLSNVDHSDPGALARRAGGQWVYFSGSHYCPLCLAEDAGAWQLTWKLPWSFACTRHAVLLGDTCPQCNQRSGTGRSDNTLTPLFVDKVPRPGHCGNPQPMGVAVAGRGAVPCGFTLAEASCVDVSGFARLMDTQRWIGTMLAHAGSASGRRSEAIRSTLLELRSVSALILWCGNPEILGELPAESRAAFSAHVAEGEEQSEARSSLADGRKGKRQRVFWKAPTSTALVAAVLPLAASIVRADDPSVMVERARGLGESLARKDPRMGWALMRDFGFSERLAALILSARGTRQTFDFRVGSRSITVAGQEGSFYAFEPRHVPQLLPKNEYDEHFRALIPGVRVHKARRFCAMSLVKLCGAYTWAESAELLILPVAKEKSMANRIVGVLQKANTYEAFTRELNRIAGALAANTHRLDYGARRQALHDFTLIPEDEWRQICDSAQMDVGRTEWRNRYATAWLWAELTGGDWKLAPGLEGLEKNIVGVLFSRFEHDLLPTLSPFLLRYGTRMLQVELGPHA